jgi:enterochelin esterase-like enzyme
MFKRIVRTLSLVAALLLSIAPPALSQDTDSPGNGKMPPQKASPPRFGRAVRSPEVHADGRVTFRFRAPGAKKSVLVLDGAAPALMLPDENGVWSFTTAVLAPDFYRYYFVVDDVALADPSNPLAKTVAVGGHESMVHVPGSDSLSWEVRDIPHGVLHRHEYHSVTVGESRAYWVYTPPGYNSEAPRRYPVLYLLHGVMEDSTAWVTAGRANVILDNLIERGLAKPMLAVFPLGYGFANVPDRVGDLLNGTVKQQQVMDVFAKSLVNEVMPQVERNYRVEKGRQSRAIAGLSMGGSQAIYIGLNHLDQFAWIGSFSAASIMFIPGYEKYFPNLGAGAHPRFRLFWVSVGTEDFLLSANRRFTAWLQSKNVQFTGIETPGGHAWMVWRRNLTEFAPLLFQSAPKSGSNSRTSEK